MVHMYIISIIKEPLILHIQATKIAIIQCQALNKVPIKIIFIDIIIKI